jgi:hypothetical protein
MTLMSEGKRELVSRKVELKISQNTGMGEKSQKI